MLAGRSMSSHAARGMRRRGLPLLRVPLVESFAELLELGVAGLGFEHVVEQTAAGEVLAQIREVAPRDGFDVRLAEGELVDGVHPLGLKLRVPTLVPASALGGIKSAIRCITW